jgi:hypothetical protein
MWPLGRITQCVTPRAVDRHHFSLPDDVGSARRERGLWYALFADRQSLFRSRRERVECAK